MASNKPGAFAALQVPMIDPKTGTITYTWLKQIQLWQQQLAAGFDTGGNLISNIEPGVAIVGRAGTLGAILQNIDQNGVTEANGIDFARAYLNKDTDHISDGTGSPLAGGKAAQTALVVSPPVPEAHKWVNGFVAGVFTKTQPDFSDLLGTATPAQIPALSALAGQITTAQLPAAGISVTIATAKRSPGGTEGSMTYTNGLLTASTPAT